MATTTGKKRVIFSIDAPEAEAVSVCGCFNAWDPKKTPLKRDAAGKWKAQLMLAPGRYEYRLRVDGCWVDDPTAEAHVPNPFGTSNCVREVGLAA